jgi:hypothetical protein
VNCISFVWLEPSRLHKLDYVRLAPVLGLTVEPDGAQKACFEFVTKILKRPYLLSARRLAEPDIQVMLDSIAFLVFEEVEPFKDVAELKAFILEKKQLRILKCPLLR